MIDNIAVIGLGGFGKALVLALARRGKEVLAIDKEQSIVDDISSTVSHSFTLDATDGNALIETGIQEMDIAIVSVGELDQSLLITMLLKEIGIKEVWVKANDKLHNRLLEKIGADKIFQPELDMAERITSMIINPNISDIISFPEGVKLVEIKAKPSMVGKTLKSMDFRRNYGVNIIAIKRLVNFVSKDNLIDSHYQVNTVPGGDDIIEEGDILFIIGKEEELKKLTKL